MEDVKYTSIPIEDNENKAPPKLETVACTGHNPALQPRPCCRGRVFRKVLFGVLALVLAGRFILAGFNILLRKHNTPDPIIYDADYPGWNPPEWKPMCSPTIEWEGNSEYLLDPDDISGLIYTISGASQGKVILRQDPWSYGYINITSRILLSDNALQEDIRVEADITDDDFEIKIETPQYNTIRRCVNVVTEITLPSYVKYFRSLTINVPNADVQVEALGDLDFAYLNIVSSNGRINIDDISVASADVSTVNGHIYGGFEVAESLEVKNVNGAIYIRSRLNPWAEDVSIAVKSINGQIDVNVRDIAEQQSLDFFARNINGGIIAFVDDAFEGEFSASTIVGFANVQGEDIAFDKNTRSSKSGFKGDKNKDKNSNAKLEAVTGSVELVFH